MGKRFFAFAFCLVLAISESFASGLTFQIVQHNGSLSDVCESAMLIEDNMLNYFFDSGYIVSNAKASVSSSEEQNEKLWKDAVSETAEGSGDVFVQIHLYFNENAKDDSKVALGLIDKVSWKAISIKTGKILEESSMTVKKPMGSDSEENVKSFAYSFADHLKIMLKNYKNNR